MDASENGSIRAPVQFTISTHEERIWSELSDLMGQYHEGFKREFDTIFDLADGSFNKRGMSLVRYLKAARDLTMHLNAHHMIEERYIFPKLAERMSAFATGANGAHIASHRAIHAGINKLSALVDKYYAKPSSYSPDEMKACLNSFRAVLFTHLDQEVADLKGDNLRKYWTLKEMQQMRRSWSISICP